MTVQYHIAYYNTSIPSNLELQLTFFFIIAIIVYYYFHS